MAHFLSSVYRSPTSLLTRSLFLLTFSQTLMQYNTSNAKPYIPSHALQESDIQSILSIADPILLNDETRRRYDYHQSRRTMLYFLLAMKSTNNERLMGLIAKCKPSIDWSKLENTYNDLKESTEPYQQQYRAEDKEDGFQMSELKLYWNYQEIKDLKEPGLFNPEADQDSHDKLLDSPVEKRDCAGEIKFIRSGIEEAVFQAPVDKQVIVLDFADERMPGGYYLENARTQEEVILFNSDGYRALLDLKYNIMDGGYMLPEFGVAYIQNVRFFRGECSQERLTDLIVAACYDLSGMDEGLYKPPSRENFDDMYDRTYKKVQAIIASAVANTNGNGKSTYLLLGPIGTGAFANNMQMIAKIFSKILNEPLMDSKKAIRYAFEQIWFVSIDDLSVFAGPFSDDKSNTN
ncbi:hypothetical protein I4U23_007286 [Adineta vaga]|nr:hypothetical protein I4U23_007286 [Adineta vaga]